MNHCAATAAPLKVMALFKNAGCSMAKPTAAVMRPEATRVREEMQHDPKLRFKIWLYFEVACSLNNFSWKVEVKPSKAKKPHKSAKP